MTAYEKIIEGSQNLSVEEMEEMIIVINNILIQRKREEIKLNAEETRKL